MPTREQFLQKINEMEREGKSRTEVQNYLDSFRQPTLPADGVLSKDKIVDVYTKPKFKTLKEIAEPALMRVGREIGDVFKPNIPFVQRIAEAGELPLRAAGAAAEIAGGVVGEPIRAVFEKLPEEEKQRIQNSPLSKLVQKIGALTDKSLKEGKTTPELVQTAKDVFEAFSWVVGGRAAKTGVEAAKPTIEAGIKAGEEVVERGIEAGLETTGKIATISGRAAKETGRSLMQRAITPTTGEAERLQAFRARSPFLTRTKEALLGEAQKRPLTRAETALEKGIAGTEKMIGVQARRETDALWKTIEPAVKASPVRITREKLFEPLERIVSGTTEPSRKKALQEALDSLKEDYIDIKDFSLEQAQAVKRELDEFTPEKLFRGKNVANEARVLQHEMADVIRQKTYDALEDINIKKSYLDYGNLIELQKVGVKALTEAGRQAGSGKLVSYLWDKATIPVKTIGAQVLYRVGNWVEFVGEKGIKTFGDFLQKKGFKI